MKNLPNIDKLILVHTNDPEIKTMGGGVAYMNFLLRNGMKNNIPVKYLGVQFAPNERRLADHWISNKSSKIYDKINILNESDHWLKFFLVLMKKVYSINTSDCTVVHAQRLLYLFPFVFWRKKGVLY